MDRLTKLIPESLKKEIRSLRKLDSILDVALPDKLRNHARVTGASQTTLSITVDSQNWASQIRYYESAIASAMYATTGRADWKIRIRVRAAGRHNPDAKPLAKGSMNHNARGAVAHEKERLRKILHRIGE
ncbi:MAG TPA: DUF721 domain-containing protein [Gammaproteobacteria bacterium]|nr:DUF721 domain-containing protein [Gammaproteobacteria bacterium]